MPVRQMQDTWEFEKLGNRSDLISNVCVPASGSQAWSKCRADTHVTALAKGSKVSKGAKDCFTELRTSEALPPHQRFAPTRRSGHSRLTIASRRPGARVTAASPSLRADQALGSLPPHRRNAPERQSFDPRAPFATFARTIPAKPNPLPPREAHPRLRALLLMHRRQSPRLNKSYGGLLYHALVAQSLLSTSLIAICDVERIYPHFRFQFPITPLCQRNCIKAPPLFPAPHVTWTRRGARCRHPGPTSSTWS